MPLEFSSEVKTRIEAIAARYPKRSAALLPVLHFVQHEYGYLSHDVQSAVALQLDVPPTLVREVTTFYEMFHEHPEGQFHLEICTNIACHLAGADAITAHLKKTLNIEVGHQSEDGMFSLMEAECLASCGSGPTLRCGADYYEYLTIPAIDGLLKQFRERAPSLNGKHYDQGPNGPHVGPVPGFEAPAASQPTRHVEAPGVELSPSAPPPSAASAVATPAADASAPAPRAPGDGDAGAAAKPPEGASLPSFAPPPLKKKANGEDVAEPSADAIDVAKKDSKGG